MNYYEIKFNGLKVGSHSNSFKIKDKFFDTFENSEIKQAEITASTTLNKQHNKTTLDINLVGTINNIPCDICTEKIDIPIIGIEPGIRPAILNTKSKNIGVLATEKTLESKLFNSTSKNNLTDDITIHEQVGYGLVNEIEKGINGNILIEKYLKKYVVQ